MISGPMKELDQKTQGAPCCELGCQRHMTTYTLFQPIKRILCARLDAQKQRSPALHELVYNSTEEISGGPRVFKENCFKSLKKLLSSLEGLWNTDQQSRAHREPGFPRVDFLEVLCPEPAPAVSLYTSLTFSLAEQGKDSFVEDRQPTKEEMKNFNYLLLHAPGTFSHTKPRKRTQKALSITDFKEMQDSLGFSNSNPLEPSAGRRGGPTE